MNKKTIKMDLHNHTTYSYDGKSSMEEFIVSAIEKSIDVLCFTEHVELMGWFRNFYVLNYKKYFDEFKRLREKYEGKIKLLIGMEFGEPHILTKDFDYAKSFDFDMIIGSMHRTMDGNPAFDDGSVSEIHYETTLEMVNYGGFDVLGHLDVPKRYGFNITKDEFWEKEIFKSCIKKRIIPEINTSSLRRGFLETMPDMSSIVRYKEVGGRYVTVGSDSHSFDTIGADIDGVVSKLPKEISLCYFEKRELKTTL